MGMEKEKGKQKWQKKIEKYIIYKYTDYQKEEIFFTIRQIFIFLTTFRWEPSSSHVNRMTIMD